MTPSLICLLLGGFHAALTPVTLEVGDNGWITATTDSERVLTAGAGWPVNVQVDDAPLLAESESISQEALNLPEVAQGWRYSTARGVLEMRVTPFPSLGETAWLRSLTYRNTSESVQDLTHAEMRLAPVVDETVVPWQPKNFFMAKTTGNACIAVAYKGTTDFYRLSRSGDGVLHAVDACWRLAPGEEAVIEAQGFWLADAPPGEAPDARLWSETFRAEAQRWYEAIDIRVPGDMPDWVRGMVLYEYNPGGHIDSRFSDVGGFQRLAGQSGYLAEMGVTAVWLQGIHSHKTPPNPVEGGWNLYDPRDVLAVDEILGGEAGLRELLDSLEAAGIRVLGEIVPHGGHSVQGEAMPEWWTHERDGTPRRNWGGWGMDHASPPWQDLMAEAMARQARDFGIVGCRIDVADGNGPNWNSPLTNHASFSTLGGAVQLLSKVRDAMAQHTPYPVLIPEAFDQVEYFSVAPVGYGHDFWMFILNQVETMVEEPAAMAALFREHLERERGSLPPGALTLRTLNNHDTVCEAGRATQRFGAGLARALHALCLVIPGVPMLYQEQEIGSWHALRALHQARAGIPAFTSEAVDYEAVSLAPEAFACLRGTAETGYAIGLVNLSGETVSGVVRLADHPSQHNDAAIPNGAVVRDALSCARATIADGGFPWRLPPYGAAFLEIDPPQERLTEEAAVPVVTGEEASQALPGDRPDLIMDDGMLFLEWGGQRLSFLAGDGDWMLGADDGEGRTYMNGALELQVRTEEQGLACVLTFGEPEDGDAWPTLEVTGTDEWLVAGRTALLRDKALRRHYPWPEETGYQWDKNMFWGPHPAWASYDGLSPTGRLWESAFEPLHPDAPLVGFGDATGIGVVLQDIKSDGSNILLYEAAVADAPVLRLAFRGYDRELAPHINFGGPGAPYRVRHPEPNPRSVFTASFTVTLRQDMDAVAAGLEANLTPLPADRQRHRRLLEGPGAQVSSHIGIVFPEPGAVTWENLALPERYAKLQFTLRHSESGPEGTDLDDAYRIRINGVETPFTWTQRTVSSHANAYFGHAEVELAESSDTVHTIRIETLKDWCILKEQFDLL